jgi:F-type H+-transporting ATPase subunit alpha
LRLFYSQFEELEVFSRFGSRLDEQTRTTLARGRAIREALKQPQFDPLPASVQVATLVAATAGLFDNLSPEQVANGSAQIRSVIAERLPGVIESIEAGKRLSDADRAALVTLAEEAIACKPPSH